MNRFDSKTARAAAKKSWTPERRKAHKKAIRDAFARKIDPEGVLSPEEREEAVSAFLHEQRQRGLREARLREVAGKEEGGR